MKVAREMPITLFGDSSPSIMDIPEPGVITLNTNDWTEQEKKVLNTLLALVADRRDNQ